MVLRKMKEYLGFLIVYHFVVCGANPCSRPISHGAILPDRNDCERFYICVWGQSVHFTCPAGLHFNPVIRVCDWPGNVDCSQTTTTTTSASTISVTSPSTEAIHTTTTSPSSVNTTLNTAAPTVSEEQDSNQQDSNQQDSNQQESKEDHSHEQGPCGPHDHGLLLADPGSCDHFYQCVHGQSIQNDCPNELHFNENLQVCDWPVNVGCEGSGDGDSGESAESTEAPDESEEDGSGDSIEQANCGRIEHGDLTPDPLDCGRYYQCTWGRNILRQCPKGLHFNWVLKVCDWPYQAQCNVSILEENA